LKEYSSFALEWRKLGSLRNQSLRLYDQRVFEDMKCDLKQKVLVCKR
jgi:hypothetical protein